MATTARYIADGALIKLNQATGGASTRFTDAEALRFINDGQLAIVGLVRRAYTKRVVATPESGVSRQTLAGLSISDGVSIIDVPSNYTADGLARTTAITKRDRSHLDDMVPSWRTVTGVPKHWCYDPDDPKAFDLTPAPTTTKLELIYGATPPSIASIGSNISLDDIYAPALEAYLLYSWCSKASDQALQGQAVAYMQMFQSLLGVREQKPAAQGAAANARAIGNAGAV